MASDILINLFNELLDLLTSQVSFLSSTILVIAGTTNALV